MSGTPPRPAPLRVPVDEVAERASLVAPSEPDQDEMPVVEAVVRRAVHIVSDVPPAGPGAQFEPPSVVARAPAEAEAAVAEPEVEPEPELDDDLVVESEQPLVDEPEIDGATAAAADDFDPPPVVTPRVSAPPPIPPEARQLRGDAEVVGLSPASPERSSPESSEELLSLSDEIPLEGGLADVVRAEASTDGAQATDLTRSSDFEINVSFEDEEGDTVAQAYHELEELDIPVDETDPPPARPLTPPPPPPPGLRLGLAEPPDLSTLTRSTRVAEARPSRPRPHPWWEVLFDDEYLRTVRPPTHAQIARQCDFITGRLGLKSGATVLDVGCGLGLQVVELTARGYLGVGLDLSLAMLSRASEEAQARGTKVNLLHADMRDMNFDGAFDAVICMGTTFGYFDDESNRRVLERLYRALKPNGVLLLDVVNRDHVIRNQPNLIWFEGDGCVCMEESEFNFFTSRLHIKRTVILDQGKQRENEYSLRLYALHELGQLLHGQGFRVTEVSGREALPGVFFGNESPNMMVVAERRTPLEAGSGRYPSLSDT